MNSKRLGGRIRLLLEQLDQAYYAKAWHGTTLKGSLRGLRLKQVLWRPRKKRHNIWEIVLHCAYWKYAVRRRMTGEKQGSFPFKGSDWIKLPEVLEQKSWRQSVSLLHDMHLLLRETVANLPPSKLEYVPTRAKVPNYITILGIASHDLYHAGQIQLLKKLMKK
ncbi:MAG: hypothetical protein GF310_11455 [candidate division Zixibacteria bacterium]|nr:hypothetical protein [candidate division Zixibacteria bacterium]